MGPATTRSYGKCDDLRKTIGERGSKWTPSLTKWALAKCGEEEAEWCADLYEHDPKTMSERSIAQPGETLSRACDNRKLPAYRCKAAYAAFKEYMKPEHEASARDYARKKESEEADAAKARKASEEARAASEAREAARIAAMTPAEREAEKRAKDLATAKWEKERAENLAAAQKKAADMVREAQKPKSYDPPPGSAGSAGDTPGPRGKEAYTCQEQRCTSTYAGKCISWGTFATTCYR